MADAGPLCGRRRADGLVNGRADGRAERRATRRRADGRGIAHARARRGELTEPVTIGERSIGHLYAGTSGFAYPGWAPAFYPAGSRADALLPYYASRLDACELNNTYYQQPSESKVAAWLRATPSWFRFAVKAQRGGSYRSFAVDPEASVPWLTAPLARFGDRLGSVLFRVPDPVRRDDLRLAALLAAWPSHLPLTLEFQDASWHVDETFDALARAGAALCATEMPDDETPPEVRLTGPFLYLRLRRNAYDPAELAAWADRLAPFLDAGTDTFVFFRHDETGLAPGYAETLRAALTERLGTRGPSGAGPLGRVTPQARDPSGA